jgi:transaldolase/glucose-6-phosphate isomerase
MLLSHNRIDSEGTLVVDGDDAKVYANVELTGADLKSTFDAFLAQAGSGDYISIHAYLPHNAEMQKVLDALRLSTQQQTGLATTLGFCPRFLYSTEQLHKGGANNGLFIQITMDAEADIDIPTQGMSFGTLEFWCFGARLWVITLRWMLPGAV